MTEQELRLRIAELAMERDDLDSEISELEVQLEDGEYEEEA